MISLLRIMSNMHLLAGTHWLAQRIRVKQLTSVVERLQSQRHWPIIFAGDFNEHAMMAQKTFYNILQSRGLTHSFYFEPYECLPSYRINNPLVHHWLHRSPYSRRLDYIFVSLPAACDLHVVHYAPLYLTPPLSDHDPVLLSLSAA